MDLLPETVTRARDGDLDAYGRLVSSTQLMAYAVALRVLRDSAQAEDAIQEAYLRAFRRLRDLDEPAAFIPWLRRIVITEGDRFPELKKRYQERIVDRSYVEVVGFIRQKMETGELPGH